MCAIGGDHFAVLVPHVRETGNLHHLTQKALGAFVHHPFRLNGSIFRVSGNVGIALFPQDGADAEALFKNAEAALKKAIEAGAIIDGVSLQQGYRLAIK